MFVDIFAFYCKISVVKCLIIGNNIFHEPEYNNSTIYNTGRPKMKMSETVKKLLKRNKPGTKADVGLRRAYDLLFNPYLSVNVGFSVFVNGPTSLSKKWKVRWQCRSSSNNRYAKIRAISTSY